MAHFVITNRFIDGLKEDIRAVVVVHHPPNIDTASSLVLLQEEVTHEYSKREYKKQEGSSYSRRPTLELAKSTTWSLPATPTKPHQPHTFDERKIKIQ